MKFIKQAFGYIWLGEWLLPKRSENGLGHSWCWVDCTWMDFGYVNNGLNGLDMCNTWQVLAGWWNSLIRVHESIA